jgi:Bacterial membrane protein YfhO
VFGKGDKSSGEPGYASERIDFLKARDSLDWSLPAVWGLACSKGETPMIPKRLLDYFDSIAYGAGRFDIESVSHMVVGRHLRKVFLPSKRVGAAFIHKNPNVLPRARLVGRPEYVENASAGVAALKRLGAESRQRLIVEDPTKPLDPLAEVSGAARIVNDLPERVVIETESSAPAYLVLADTFDPGWSATVDGHRASIYPAYVAFRAVFLPKGTHTVIFSYRPAGFDLGLGISIAGVVLAIVLWFWKRADGSPLGDHLVLTRSARFRKILFLTLAAIVLASVPRIGPGPRFSVQRRWATGFHRFTWGAGIAAMKENRQ